MNGKKILKGVDLRILPGEIHAIMGRNGAGKSTLARVLAGDPAYEVTEGEVWFLGKNLLECSPEERAHLGLFMSFQYPVALPGISNALFLKAAHTALSKARGAVELKEEALDALIEEKMRLVEMQQEFKDRSVNEGFSGGEKKRSEILHMAVLEPKLAILDETDSGLDIDAMRIVAKGIKSLHTKDNALLLITHYQRLLEYLTPDVVHVMIEGKIVRSGGKELALELEEKGYTEIHAQEVH